jgi:oligopeptidase B
MFLDTTTNTSPAPPPAAPRRPVAVTLHGDTRLDEYAWLRDRDDPAVVRHLEAENAHAEAAMAHTAALQRALYDEFVGRLQETDATVPYRDGAYLYYTRTRAGLDYPIHCRRGHAPGAPEEVLLDVNELSLGHGHFRLTDHEVSPDGRHLAYAIDTTGYEVATVFIRDLAAGRIVGQIPGAWPFGLAWASDGRTLYYVRTDATKRPDRVLRHALGTDSAGDAEIFRERDERFTVGVARSRSGGVIFITAESVTTSEAWFLDAADPSAAPRVIAPRRGGVRYSADHHPDPVSAGGTFYIVTDAGGCPNFTLVAAPAGASGPEHWIEIIAHSDDVYLAGVHAFANHLVLSERCGGLTGLRVRRLSDGREHVVELPEPAGTVSFDANREFATGELRFRFESLVTPPGVYDYDMDAQMRTLRKRDAVPGYDPARYESRRIRAAALDGAEVPVSIVHRRGLSLDGGNPCLLVGYGAYGISLEPWFNPAIVSLLDRGFVYAIAHVRGGSELGRRWREEGRLLRKRNTFTDFVAAAEHLVDAGYTSPERLAIQGRSAGGLLIGAVLNMRSDLFAAAHAAVPFVDALGTMLDPAIPLTTFEYEEWGDPRDAEYYRCIRSYSPYDNIASRRYPDVLVTSGLNDPRVHYWEPAKWAARLRAGHAGNRVLLRTNMGAGHGGASGRYERYRELAFEYAFLVDCVGAPRRAGKERENLHA